MYENLQEKWEKIINVDGLPEIKDSHRRDVTATLLENQLKSARAIKQPMPEQNFKNMLNG